MPSTTEVNASAGKKKLPSISARASLETENELRHFLRVARPEWSCPTKKGQNNIARVMEKLRAIDIHDIETLVQRLEKNTINDDLVAHGHIIFSREAMDGMRRQLPFIRALEVLAQESPHVRQVGSHSSVRQLLAKKRIMGNDRNDDASSRVQLAGEDRKGLSSTFGACGFSNVPSHREHLGLQLRGVRKKQGVGGSAPRGTFPPAMTSSMPDLGMRTTNAMGSSMSTGNSTSPLFSMIMGETDFSAGMTAPSNPLAAKDPSAAMAATTQGGIPSTCQSISVAIPPTLVGSTDVDCFFGNEFVHFFYQI